MPISAVIRHSRGLRLRLDVAQLLGDGAGLGQHLQHLVVGVGAACPVAAHQHHGQAGAVVHPPRDRDRLVAQLGAALGLADERTCPGQPRQQQHAQRGVAGIERRQRLLQQLDRALVEHRHPPAGGLHPDRGAGQKIRVVEPPRRLGGRPERLQGIAGLAGPVVGGAQLQLDLGVGGLVVDAQLERRAQRADRLAERQRGVGGGGRPQVVLDGPLGAVDGRRGGEVVGEVGQSARRVGGAGRLHRLRHLQVQLGPAQARQPVVQGAAHQLVGEPVAQLPGRDLLDHAAAHRLLQRGRQRGVA